MSSEEWIKVQLGDLASVNCKSISNNYPYKEIEYIDTSSVTKNEFNPPQKIKLTDAPSRARRIVQHGDTILSTVRPIQRHFGYIRNPKPNTIVSTGFAVITPKSINPEFFYYYLSQDSITNYLNSIAETSTTTFPAFRPEILSDLEIEIPKDENTQRRIADILSALDDKIELNRQTNATFEAIAQAIFKEWFVDFNYPGATGEMVDSPLGLIPKGWRAGTVGDALIRVSAGKVFDFKSASPIGKVPILDQSHFTVIGYHNEVPGVKASIENPVIVFSNHRCYIDLIQFPFSAIQNVLPFVGDQVDTRWLYHATDGIITYSEYKGHWPEFISKPLLIPPLIVTKMYGDLVKPTQVLRLHNLRESHLLRKLRETILPKLISGEIEV